MTRTTLSAWADNREARFYELHGPALHRFLARACIAMVGASVTGVVVMAALHVWRAVG